MRLDDAPPAGWYPDPEGGTHLRWWEGTDWTDHRRAPASTSELEELAHAVDEAAPNAAGEQIRAARDARQEADEIVMRVREAAREEAARAADLVAQRARTTIDRGRSVVDDYIAVVLRWVRVVVVIAALLVIAWFVLEFIAQATFLNWLGDRIDGLTGS